MAANKPGKAEILAAFFDDGTYAPLFTDGAVSAAYGCANGQNAYVVFEDGSPVGVQDIEKNIRVLEMAAETGAPVVTFYDSTGAKLEGGLDLLNANARLTAEIARVSGVVPQVAVVTGTCAGTNAINAAAAYLGSAVYQLYRHLYRHAGANEAYFALDPNACTMDAAQADMKVAEIRYARSLRTMAAKKAEFPDLSPDALSDAYPGRCQSLTQVLSTADARLTALTTEREA